MDRRIGIVALLGLAVLSLVLVTRGGSSHHVRVLAPEARYMMPGAQVRAAGQVVGKVTEAEPTRQGQAQLTLGLDDDVWPLPRGTVARMRWTGTIGMTGRYVELQLPAERGRDIPENGVISGRDIAPTVELDQITALFDRSTRGKLRATLDAGGRALGPVAPSLRRALDAAPPAVDEGSRLLTDLAADRDALHRLVRSTDRVVHAVQTSKPGVDTLIADGATTLAAVGRRARDVQRGLAELPSTLDTAKAGLADADRTLRTADDVLTRLAPGVRQLRAVAGPLHTLLRSLTVVAPQATATVTTLGRATRDLDPLLNRAHALMPRIDSVTREATKQVTCIRPYAPEAAGLASNWVGFISHGDGRDKYARVNGGVYPHATSLSQANAEQWVKLFPGLSYAFPRPPGHAAGQPQFDDGCGVGKDSLDPSKDPEKIK